jgi:hypothetical protein
VEIVNLALEIPCDFNMIDDSLCYPADYAALADHPDVLRSLVEKGVLSLSPDRGFT